MTIRCYAYVDRSMMALFFATIVTTSCYVAASIFGASYIKPRSYAAKEHCSNNHKCKQQQSDFILSDLVSSDTKTKSHHDSRQTKAIIMVITTIMIFHSFYLFLNQTLTENFSFKSILKVMPSI